MASMYELFRGVSVALVATLNTLPMCCSFVGGLKRFDMPLQSPGRAEDILVGAGWF